MAKITVIGSFVTDNVVTMQKFPQAGETVLGMSIERFLGGKGANQCVAAARLGGDVEMIGMLGEDADGVAFRAVLSAEKIETRHIFSCKKATGTAQVQIDGSGQNRICVIPSANHAFGMRELALVEGAIKETEYVLMQLELRLDVTFEAIRRAHALGAKVILNPAPAAPIPNDIFPLIDCITPNETELAALSGLPTGSDSEIGCAALALRKRGVGTVVVTLGGRGAYYSSAEGCGFVRGYRVKAVDTVAAGDSFNGALAVAFSEGKGLEEAVRFANATGALTVMTKGAIPSLRTRAEVERFLKTHTED